MEYDRKTQILETTRYSVMNPFSFLKRIFKSQPLYFHRGFLQQEFCGDTPEEVVQALYEDSKIGMNNISFADWWDYQRWVHGIKYNTPFPNIDEPEACQKMLVCFLKGGRVEVWEIADRMTRQRDKWKTIYGR